MGREHPQASKAKHWEPPGARRGQEGSSPSTQRERPWDTSISDL